MSDVVITCPQCGHQFPLSDALAAQLHARFDAQHRASLEAAVREAEARAHQQLAAQLKNLEKMLAEQAARTREAEARELALQQKALQLEEAQRQAIERARIETEARLRKEAEERTAALIAQAEQQARAAVALEKQHLEARLAEERAKLEQAQKAELALRRQAEDLERRARELDLELARRLDAKRAEWEAHLRQTLAAEQDLKLKEKEKQIEDMKRVIDELKRKSEQGSQELQGEVLELDIQAALERQFPHDEIQPVPKGVSGADLIQTVLDGQGRACGKIVWETKNTKHWSPQWLAKLKDDTRAVCGNLAVLVSSALPEGVHEFGLMEGVWVASRRAWPALAVALREQLVQVAFAQASQQGRNEKMAQLYDYLASEAFRHRIEAIVEAYQTLREQVERERRLLLRHWAEREKLLERAMLGASGMYGDVKGILGQAMTDIPALEVDEAEPPLLGRDPSEEG